MLHRGAFLGDELMQGARTSSSRGLRFEALADGSHKVFKRIGLEGPATLRIPQEFGDSSGVGADHRSSLGATFKEGERGVFGDT